MDGCWPDLHSSIMILNGSGFCWIWFYTRIQLSSQNLSAVNCERLGALLSLKWLQSFDFFAVNKLFVPILLLNVYYRFWLRKVKLNWKYHCYMLGSGHGLSSYSLLTKMKIIRCIRLLKSEFLYPSLVIVFAVFFVHFYHVILLLIKYEF